MQIYFVVIYTHTYICILQYIKMLYIDCISLHFCISYIQNTHWHFGMKNILFTVTLRWSQRRYKLYTNDFTLLRWNWTSLYSSCQWHLYTQNIFRDAHKMTSHLHNVFLWTLATTVSWEYRNYYFRHTVQRMISIDRK